MDVRNDESEVAKLRSQGQNPITNQQGQELSKKLGAIRYMECSAKTQENLKGKYIKIHYLDV